MLTKSLSNGIIYRFQSSAKIRVVNNNTTVKRLFELGTIVLAVSLTIIITFANALHDWKEKNNCYKLEQSHEYVTLTCLVQKQWWLFLFSFLFFFFFWEETNNFLIDVSVATIPICNIITLDYIPFQISLQGKKKTQILICNSHCF